VLHADKVIQVDDFAPDFDAAKGIATKQDYLKMRHESDVTSRVAREAHKFAAE
jgi:hypothetical protein